MSEFVGNLDFEPSLYDDALMAILPPHAERLYDGSKLFEFRKTIPRIVPKRIFLYETGGTGAVTGHIVVDEVLVGSPEYVWSVTGEVGTTRKAFDSYFAGRHLAYAFRVGAAVRYSLPVRRDVILQTEGGFRVPQNFLYMQNLPRLSSLLSRVAVDETFAASTGPLKMGRIEEGDRTEFIAAVREHVSRGYSETGRAYADKLLAIAEAGEDPEGFLTLAKYIRSLRYRGKHVGYAVLTFKVGGSVKTGPVILSEEDRAKGIGKLLRAEIHRAVGALGCRKVFATVPADNQAGVQYLLSSGYRIEAHLRRPYHPKHDEFVLGTVLSARRGPAPEFVRQITPVNEFWQVEEPSDEIAAFLREEFSAAYCRVSDDWALRQVRMACQEGTGFKPRHIFVACNARLMAMAVCLPKRGGSAKVLLLTRTGHQPSLVGLLRFASERLAELVGDSLRRIYTQVSVGDTDVIGAFQAFACRPEGVIELPFSANADTLILAKDVCGSTE